MTRTDTSSYLDIASTVGRLATAFAQPGQWITQGDLASLRRMDPRHPAPAFFKVMSWAFEDPPQASEDRWAAILVGLAHLREQHRFEAHLGQALVSAGFSELRFSRLLRADTERLLDELPSLARFFRAKHVDANWTSAAQLMLSSEQPWGESCRRNLARDYFRATAKITTPTP